MCAIKEQTLFLLSYFCSVDVEKPTFTLCPEPDDLVVNILLDKTDAIVTWSDPEVMDNSGTVTVSSNHDSGDRFSLGTYVVEFSARDGADNVADNTCPLNITVKTKGSYTVETRYKEI